MLQLTPKRGASPFVLTARNVKDLLENNSSQVRVDVTERIASAYQRRNLNGREAHLAECIFKVLLRDMETRVRVSMAQQLKECEDIPHHIILSLARDVNEVALPVLQYSNVLSDSDLLELIEATGDIARFLAISGRETVSVAVSDSLIAKGNSEVASVLVNNPGADLSEAGLEKIIAAYHENEGLMTAVSNRPQLPTAAVEKLITVVSSSLAASLKKKYKVAAGDIDKQAEKVREAETLSLIRAARSPDDIERLITQLFAYDRLTPSIILSALCQGDFAFFETSLARLSNIPVSNARTLIHDRGELGFRALYNKSGLSEAMFPAVKLLLRVVCDMDAEGERPGMSNYPDHVVERLLARAQETPVDNLSYILALIRQAGQ